MKLYFGDFRVIPDVSLFFPSHCAHLYVSFFSRRCLRGHFILYFFHLEAVSRCAGSERRGQEFNSAESRITHTGESEKL